LEKNPITGIILSGGQSTRMGKNKALLEVEGVRIIERIHALFEKLFQEILIIGDQKEVLAYLGAPVYPDVIPNQGAMGGLYTGLYFASFPYSFCVACDMPFLKRSLIDYLITHIDAYDAIVPRTRDGLQPLHALYSKSCAGVIKRMMEQKRTKIIDFYPLVNLRIIDEEEFRFLDPQNESFINVNTPEELASLETRK
jgi:molybdenum cofactor guanylyltransferase